MSKIVSINAAHTKSMHAVAYNLDQKPLPGAIERVKYGILQIRYEDDLLWVTVPERHDSRPLDKNAIATLNQKIAEAEQELNDAAQREAAARADAVRYLSQLTGLPIA